MLEPAILRVSVVTQSTCRQLKLRLRHTEQNATIPATDCPFHPYPLDNPRFLSLSINVPGNATSGSAGSIAEGLAVESGFGPHTRPFQNSIFRLLPRLNARHAVRLYSDPLWPNDPSKKPLPHQPNPLPVAQPPSLRHRQPQRSLQAASRRVEKAVAAGASSSPSTRPAPPRAKT